MKPILNRVLPTSAMVQSTKYINIISSLFCVSYTNFQFVNYYKPRVWHYTLTWFWIFVRFSSDFTKFENMYHVINNIRRITKFYENVNEISDSWFRNLAIDLIRDPSVYAQTKGILIIMTHRREVSTFDVVIFSS